MLTKPELALCENRTTKPKSNDTTGAPDDWFDNSILSAENLAGISFDFFVNWSFNPGTITPFAWIKRILPKAPTEYIKEGLIEGELLIAEIIETEGANTLELQAQFCSKHGLTLQYLLFRDINWSSNPEIIFLTTVGYSNGQLMYSIEEITLAQLMDRIQTYSGGPVNIGNKGLMYGTSTLECFLSKTKSLYPGDADLIIFRTDSFDVVTLLEFKKHNLSDPIGEQKLRKYYPNPDERKYKRLAILRDFLGQGVQIKCIYYPTRLNDYGKLELINGPSQSLVSGNATLFHLPRMGDSETYTKVTNGVIGYK